MIKANNIAIKEIDAKLEELRIKLGKVRVDSEKREVIRLIDKELDNRLRLMKLQNLPKLS